MTAEVTGPVTGVGLGVEPGRVDLDVVAAVCRAAAVPAGRGPGAVAAVVDPLDTTVWVHLPCRAVPAAVSLLRARGIAAGAVNDHRIHITGWDVRLLRWRLGVLLAAVDTLTAASELTGDLVGYHQHRRAAAGGPVEAWAVLAEVEAALRAATPLPHPTPHVQDLDSLLELVAAAEDALERLIGVHLDHAEGLLTALSGQRDGRTS